MTPAEKVAHGLELAAEGFDDLRRERTDLAQRLALNRAAIVGGEQRALSLRFEAMRDRQDRSLSGTLPARLRLRDGLRVEAPAHLWLAPANGVLIDRALLQQQSHELGQRIVELEQQAYELAGQPFNMGSPKQIGEILFTKQGLPVVKKTASGAPSTNEEVLEKLAEDYPLPAKILEHRSLAKLKGTYTDKDRKSTRLNSSHQI